jgi:hypothetical protein
MIQALQPSLNRSTSESHRLSNDEALKVQVTSDSKKRAFKEQAIIARAKRLKTGDRREVGLSSKKLFQLSDFRGNAGRML